MKKLFFKAIIKTIQGILWLIDKDHRQKHEIAMDDVKKFTHVQPMTFQSDFGEVSQIFRTVPYELWELKTTNHVLYAADKHRIINENHECVWIQDLKSGDKIKTENGIEEVISARSLNIRTHMYCVEVHTESEKDPNNHLYYSNGILSHNTTTAGSYLLWKAMFNPDTVILIAGNKLSAALEIMHRIRYAYEECPMWLKAGVSEYNKGSITFDNGSRIISRATTPDAGRGLSITLLYADEFGFLPVRVGNEFWTAISPTLACIAGDTLVLTEDGYVKIEDYHKSRQIGEYFEINDKLIWGKNGLEPISHGYVSPKSETLIIETRHGLQLEVTLDHPLYKLTKEGGSMTPSSELKTGDYLRVDYGMNVWGKFDQIDEEMAYMLGGYIAEGFISRDKYKISIDNTDEDFRNVFINNKIKAFRPQPSKSTRICCSSKQLVETWMSYGIDPSKKCYDKEVPWAILQSPKHIVSKFLSGLFDGDGSISTDKINLTSTSKKLVQQVQLLLLNYGIVSSVYLNDSVKVLARERKNKRILPHGKEVGSIHDSWSLNISRSMFKRFLAEIGFNIKRKNDKLIEYCSCYNMEEQKQHNIPSEYVEDWIKHLVSQSGKSEGWFRKNGLRIDRVIRSKTKKRNTSPEWISKFISIIEPYVDLSEHKEKIEEFTATCFWDSILRITPSTNKTYDFTVPNTHSFLQNGIIGSNTGGSCIITSTPNSDQDIFANIWRGANDTLDQNGITMDVGKNGFKAIEVTWDKHPDRDQAWADEQIASLGWDKFQREYNCKFIQEDETLINNILLSRMHGVEPSFVTGKIRWYDVPQPNKTYVLGLDPSMGTGGDDSVIQVLMLPDMVQLAEWKDNKTDIPGQIGVMLQIMNYITNHLKTHPEQYGQPEIYWSIENNSLGEAANVVIENTGLENFPGDMVNEPKGSRTGRTRWGLNTNSRTKIEACSQLKRLVDTEKFVPRSKTLVSELKNFVPRGGSYAAKTGATDNVVMATIVCIRIIKILQSWGLEDSEHLKDSIPLGEHEFEPMPFIV